MSFEEEHQENMSVGLEAFGQLDGAQTKAVL